MKISALNILIVIDTLRISLLTDNNLYGFPANTRRKCIINLCELLDNTSLDVAVEEQEKDKKRKK